MLSILSNLAGLRAIRRLDGTSYELGRSFERLSTGSRINRASDDAAGLSIAERLRNDVRISNTARRNLNDAQSLINVASGTLSEQSNLVQRLIELAQQAANGSYSSVQRAALDEEYQTLLREFGRLGDSATFNGLNILLGNRSSALQNISFQAGLNGTSNSVLSLRAPDSGTLSGVIDLRRNTGLSSLGHILGLTSEEVIDATFNGQVYSVNIVDSTGATQELRVGIGATFGDTSFNTVGLYVFRRSGEQWAPINGAPTSYSLALDPLTGQKMYQGTASQAITFDGGATATLRLNLSGLRFVDAGVNLEAPGSESISASSVTAIDFTSVRSASNALRALTVATQRLNDLSTLQGQLGAMSSRIESALRNNDALSENASAAESRIRSIDVAEESANRVRLQILRNVGAAILGNATQQPSIALSLLRDA